MKTKEMIENGIMTVNAASSFVGKIIPIEFSVSKDETEKALGKGVIVKVDIEIDDINLVIPALTGTSLTVRLQARHRTRGVLPSKMKLSEIITLGSTKAKKETLSKEALEYVKVYRIMWKKANGSVEKCRKLTALTLDITDDASIWEVVKDNCPQTS